MGASNSDQTGGDDPPREGSVDKMYTVGFVSIRHDGRNRRGLQLGEGGDPVTFATVEEARDYAGSCYPVVLGHGEAGRYYMVRRVSPRQLEMATADYKIGQYYGYKGTRRA